MRNIFSEITKRTMMRNRTRTAVTIVGVLLSTAMLTAVAVFAGSLQHFLVQETIATEGAWHVDIGGLTEEELADIRADERVKSISVVREEGYFPADENDGLYHLLMSRDETAWRELPVQVDAGRLPEQAGEILIPYGGILVNGQAAHVGETVSVPLGRVLSPEGEPAKTWELGADVRYEEEETRTFTVTGIYGRIPESNSYGNGYIFLSGPSDAVKAVGNPGAWEGTYCRVFIEMKKPGQTDGFIADWVDPASGRNKLEDVSWSRHDSLLRWQGVLRNENYIRMLGGMLVILVAVIMVGSVSLIYNSFSISLRERTAQFGLLSSVGATRKQLRKSLRWEAFFVSAAGIPLGLLAGIMGSAVTLHFIGGGLAALLYGHEGEIPVRVYPVVLALAALLAFATVLISVWIPSRRIRKISPMDAIRAAEDIRIHPREVKGGGLSGKLLGLPGMLAAKNYRRDRRKYKSTVVSLTVSMVLLMTAALFMEYLTEAGGVILDPPRYELGYTLILSGGEEDEQAIEDTQRLIEGEPGVEEVWLCRQLSITIPMEEGALASAYTGVYSWNRESAPDGKVPFTCMAIVLSDEEYAGFLEEQGLSEPETEGAVLRAVYYDKIRAYDETDGSYQQISILSDEVKHRPLAAGQYRSVGENDQGELVFDEKLQVEFDQEAEELPEKYDASRLSEPLMILSKRQFDQYMELMNRGEDSQDVESGAEMRGTEENEPVSYFAEFSIRAKDYRAVGEDLEEKLSDATRELDGIFYTPAEDAALNRQAVAAIQVLCYGFIILISLIAMANVFNTISTNLMLRRREFAMLRSVGMTGRAFRLMMGYECVIYGLRSLVYGTALSVLISLAFSRLTFRGIGGGGFLFPWAWFLASVAGVLVIVSVTMAYTMHKIRGMNIIDELRKE